ncbi:MAG TPA: sigma-70 family RNA polymerase sigma factor [Longimicrobiaceae bacterium]|nr:sigma-70 family RNA polymerase sigma factor [Longimicrobiaceae bacterium]
MEGEPGREVHGLVDGLFRREAGRMVSVLCRVFGPHNLQLAEDVVQEALLRALREWPFHGVPDDPRAWLVQVARNRALDLLRRDANLARKVPLLREELDGGEVSAPEAFFGGEVEDDQLRMIFTCCHPEVPREARVALTLKTVGGFGVPEIARAFLAREATVAQRLVRAKRRIREAGIRFEVPAGVELLRRLDPVLEVVYLVFNDGYAAASGEAALRADVCAEAVRLAELLAAHPATASPRTHALAALLLFQGARLPARVDPQGGPVLLAEQDRSRWDRGMVARGLAHLERAAEGEDLTPLHLEAGIAAAHATAPSYEATDWPYILSLYDALLAVKPSPVAALNRAVALSMVEGAGAGLRAVAEVADHPSLAAYPLLHAVRGDLHARLGEAEPAAEAYRRALELPLSEPDRGLLRRKLEECGGA